MREGLEPGATKTMEWTVTDDLSTVRGEIGVLSTPSLVLLIEETADAALADHLDTTEDSVGTSVDVKHLAATPLGMRVTITATVRQVNGREVVFDAVADDERERIGEAVHHRFVIDRARFARRVEEKAAKAAP